MPYRSFICLLAGDRQPSKKQTFALCISAGFLLACTHNVTTNRTEAIKREDDIYDPAPRIRNVLESQKRLRRHPVFIAFVTATITSQYIQDALQSTREGINQVENRTRHRPFGSTRTATGSYASLSAMTSGQATSLATIERDSTIFWQTLGFLLEYHWLHTVERPGWVGKAVQEVDECVKILVQRLKDQEIRIRYSLRRAGNQLTAVSHTSNNFMTPIKLLRGEFPCLLVTSISSSISFTNKRPGLAYPWPKTLGLSSQQPRMTPLR